MRICVFCGSQKGVRPAYTAAARHLGRALGRAHVGLVYGGGSVGLMGALADAALQNNAEVIGVIPQSLIERELARAGLTQLITVGSMHERKAKMAELADAFVALPGGFGTLDELCEILTWRQLGLHDKPIALYDVEGYFDPFLAFADHAVAEGFVRAEHRPFLQVARDPDGLLAGLFGHATLSSGRR
jgi:uncharacterized protein (TIGR00730 family)